MAQTQEFPDALRSKIRGALVAIPHVAAHVPEERVDAWLDQTWRVAKGDIGAVAEYVRRVKYLGNSDIAAALVEFAGLSDNLAPSCHACVKAKLLLTPPEPPNVPMMIGKALSGEAQKMFHQQYAAYKCETDARAMGVIGSDLRSLSGQQAWLNGDPPDDIVTMGGKRFVVDYMVSMTDRSPSEVFSRTEYNLHRLRLMVTEYGFPVEGMIVGKLWKAEDNTPCFSALQVEFDPAKEQAVLAAGDALWAKVQAGEIPGPKPEPALDAAQQNAALKAVRSYADDFAAVDAIANRAYALSARLKERLIDALKGTQVSGRHTLGAVDVNSSALLNVSKAVAALGPEAEASRMTGYSVNRMLEWFRENAVDVAQFRIPGAYDPEILKGLLAEKGLPLSDYETTQISVGLSRYGNSLAAEVKGAAAERVEALRPQLLSVVQSARKKSLTPSCG